MPAELEFGAEPIIKLDGQELAADLQLLVEEVIVHDHSHLPDMFELRFRDEAHGVLGKAGFEVGRTVEIAATPVGRVNDARPLVVGEVTALETEYEAASGSHAVVRGYDPSHRLMKNRNTRAFESRSLVDVVQSVASEAGVPIGDLSGGPARIEYVAQVNQTDWAFLQRLAREAGLELTVELGRLQLRAPRAASAAPRPGDLRAEADPLQLTLGQNLRGMRVRVSAASQVEEVEVRAWDPRQREALVGVRPARTTSVEIGISPAELAAAFSLRRRLSCDRVFETQGQVDNAAAALAEHLAASHAEAYGVADGNPELRAGRAVSVALLGTPFDGKYTITSTRHVFDDEGFRTLFEVTGREERSVLALAGGEESGSQRIDGVAVGIVTNTRDPDDLGRVRLKFPWLSDSHESWWARVAVLDAGGDSRGTLFIPEVGDEVLVAFELGDVRRPFVIGRLWNGRQKPPVDGLVDTTNGEVKRREIRSRLGHKLAFHDAPDKSGIEIVTADGKRAVFFDEINGSVVLNAGSNKIEVADAGNVTLQNSGDIDIETQGNVKIKAGGNLEIEAGGNLTLQGGGTTEVKGTLIKLN